MEWKGVVDGKCHFMIDQFMQFYAPASVWSVCMHNAVMRFLTQFKGILGINLWTIVDLVLSGCDRAFVRHYFSLIKRSDINLVICEPFEHSRFGKYGLMTDDKGQRVRLADFVRNEEYVSRYLGGYGKIQYMIYNGKGHSNEDIIGVIRGKVSDDIFNVIVRWLKGE
jgi:hypothetical protein